MLLAGAAGCGVGDFSIGGKADELAHPEVMSAAGESIPASDCAPATTGATAGDEVNDRGAMSAVSANDFAVSTANPLASEAACRVLAGGGSAADGLLAAQAVLGLVEPQSSSFGGGGFALYYDAAKDETTSYDGMETAPGAAQPTDLARQSADDSSSPQPDVRSSGRSIGVPGIPALLGAVHDGYGRKSWGEDFASARTLATDGFEVSTRLANAVSGSRDQLADSPDAAAYLMPDGNRVRSGDILRNPDYVTTLDALAEGPGAFYSGELAQSVVKAATDDSGGRTPSRMSTEDLSEYSVTTGSPLCIRYREAQLVCGSHAPEAGSTAVLSSLAILGNMELPAPGGGSGGASGSSGSSGSGSNGSDGGEDLAPESAHALSEAERLALADRSAYSADQAYVDPPDGETFSLVDPEYAKQRAAQIDPDPGKAMKKAEPGKEQKNTDDEKEEGTSHVSIVDGDGNMASMTTSLQSNFGSFHMAGGFFLNNHLENFATDPEKNGEQVANSLAGGKRPRTAMAPTMVFSSREDGSIGTPFLATGSPGGSEITSYVVKNLVAMLDWGLDPQQAAALRNVGAVSRSETIVEDGWGASNGKSGNSLVDELSGRGPDPSEAPMPSGQATILRQDGTLIGGADPRREGEVRGG